jgi:cytochrome b pre-mRNA-processing protein 3
MYFYDKIRLKDTYETRIYLMFMHFSLILIIFKNKNFKFPQDVYDNLFFCIENNLRELGFGDVAVNKKMKDLNKILYDILLKININKTDFKINKDLICKYFTELNNSNEEKLSNLEVYFTKLYHFCFDKDPKTMIQDALKFKI